MAYVDASSSSQGQYQNHSVLIDNLEPATGYEAKVRAMNRFGWGNTSDTFQFRTPQMGKKHFRALLTFTYKFGLFLPPF